MVTNERKYMRVISDTAIDVPKRRNNASLEHFLAIC